MNSDIWINGYYLRYYPYGYMTFYYDLTLFIREGENIIAVKVDNSMPIMAEFHPDLIWRTVLIKS